MEVRFLYLVGSPAFSLGYSRPGSRPLSTRFQEKPRRPLSTGGGFDPYPFPEKLIPEKWVALIRAYII